MSKTRDERKTRPLPENRNGNWTYRRRAPMTLVEAGICPTWIEKSLKTSDEMIARMKRDIYEQADDAQWASLLAGDDTTVAQHAYRAAVNRAEVFGLRFRSWSDIVSTDRPASTPVERVEAAMAMPTQKAEKAAVLGLVNQAKETVTQAMQLYQDVLVAGNHTMKSVAQRNVEQGQVACGKQLHQDRWR